MIRRNKNEQKSESPENLACISPKVMSTLIGNNFYSTDADITKAAIEWCKLKVSLEEKGINIEEIS